MYMFQTKRISSVSTVIFLLALLPYFRTTQSNMYRSARGRVQCANNVLQKYYDTICFVRIM